MNEVMQIPRPAAGSSLALMVERIARDPSIPLDKIREMLALQVQIEERDARREFAEAMTAAQSEMTRISADSANSQTRSKYASFAALDRAVRPIYSKHGFSLQFDTDDGAREGEVRVTCDVSCGGHQRRFHIDMPADGKGAKGGDVMTKTHAVGSAISYGRRYLLLMIFNLAVGDDDGNAAGGTTVSADQSAAIANETADLDETELSRFLKALGVEAITDIPAKDHKRALGMLASHRARKAEAK